MVGCLRKDRAHFPQFPQNQRPRNGIDEHHLPTVQNVLFVNDTLEARDYELDDFLLAVAMLSSTIEPSAMFFLTPS